MSRRDEDGDLQQMTTDDDKTVPVRVKDLEEIRADINQYIGERSAAYRLIDSIIPKPRLVQVDLDELKAIAGASANAHGSGLMDLIERLEGEQA